jgi:hypothetical protein
VDEWIRTIVGGLLGGGLATAVTWYRLRDEQISRRRSLLLDVYTAADALIHPNTMVKPIRAFEQSNKFALARAAFLLVETDPEILAKLDALRTAVRGMVRVSGPFKPGEDLDDRVGGPVDDLQRCLQELLDTARNTYRTAGG